MEPETYRCVIGGVDNGLDGGIVFLDGNGTVIDKFVMPTLTLKQRKLDGRLLCTIFEQMKPTHVFPERTQAMPGQGVSSMHSIGNSSGIVEGILIALKIPYTIVSPQTWMREMFKGLPKDGKNTTRVVCQRIWPTVDWRANERCKVAHDGLCDAALLAEYGRRWVKGGTNAGTNVNAAVVTS